MTMLLQLGVYLVKEWKKKPMWKITGLAVKYMQAFWKLLDFSQGSLYRGKI